MSPAEHAAEAERILATELSGFPPGSPERAVVIAEAQVHATLATRVEYQTFEAELGEAVTEPTALALDWVDPRVGQLIEAGRVFLNAPSDDVESLDALIAAVDAFGPREHDEEARG